MEETARIVPAATLFIARDAQLSPRPRLGSSLDVAETTGFLPLGWLALFTSFDLREETAESLALVTTPELARENLERRRDRLCDVFGFVDADTYLDQLVRRIAAAPDGASVVVSADQGVIAHDQRSVLARLISALDGADPHAWDLALAHVGGHRLRDTLGAVFVNDVAALVGNIGRLAVIPRPPRPPIALRARGAGRDATWRDAMAFILDLAEPTRAEAEHAERMWKETAISDDPAAALAAMLPTLSRNVRSVIYARSAIGGELAHVEIAESDAALQRAVTVCRVVIPISAGHPAIAEALDDPDPRVRAVLARTYRGGGDEDDDYDRDGNAKLADIDEVWRALVGDPDDRVRVGLLGNERSPIMPPPSDPSPLVRAHHPMTTIRELRTLAETTDARVLDGIYWHPNTRPWLQARIWARLEP
jgi:hypothetical protein